MSGANAPLVVVADAADRLDRALAKAAAGLSRSRVQDLIRAGHATMAGAPVTDPAARVAAGAVLTLDIPPARPPEPQGEAIPLRVVYEDEALIVIDKPPGLVVHPAGGHEGGTLVNALIAHCGESLSGIGGVRRPGIVHRLDKDTSGLLVVAKTDRAHQGLAAQFADHGRTGPLRRLYVAVAWGLLPARTGTIEASLERSAHNRERIVVVRGERGRFAITHYTVAETLRDAASVVHCTLETGRTHQIRVHLAHLGHPLLGDRLYGAGFRTKANRLEPPARAALEALDRQALHAAVLGFEHPLTGETLTFESPVPQDMATLIEALR